jgi:hypothetical protein
MSALIPHTHEDPEALVRSDDPEHVSLLLIPSSYLLFHIPIPSNVLLSHFPASHYTLLPSFYSLTDSSYCFALTARKPDLRTVQRLLQCVFSQAISSIGSTKS